MGRCRRSTTSQRARSVDLRRYFWVTRGFQHAYRSRDGLVMRAERDRDAACVCLAAARVHRDNSACAAMVYCWLACLLRRVGAGAVAASARDPRLCDCQRSVACCRAVFVAACDGVQWYRHTHQFWFGARHGLYLVRHRCGRAEWLGGRGVAHGFGRGFRGSGGGVFGCACYPSGVRARNGGRAKTG